MQICEYSPLLQCKPVTLRCCGDLQVSKRSIPNKHVSIQSSHLQTDAPGILMKTPETTSNRCVQNVSD